MNINLDFNQILNQIAEALGVTTSQIAEWYPTLIGEYSMYRFCEASTAILVGLSFAYFVLLVFYFVKVSALYEEFNTKVLTGVPVLAFSFIVVFLIEALMSPNVLLIMDIIRNMN